MGTVVSLDVRGAPAPLALSKQSANVDVVGGATYTSNGYKTALQSALDKAGFQASSTSTSS